MPDYFDNENPYREKMLQTLNRLTGDEDRDVRFYSSLAPGELTQVAYAEGVSALTSF